MKKMITLLFILVSLAFLVSCGKSGMAKEEPQIEGMILIKAGDFQMGSNGAKKDAQPKHNVILNAFYIDRYEVTNSEYKAFIDATGHTAPFVDTLNYPWAKEYNWVNGNYRPGTTDLPVVLVSWDDAAAFASWKGKRLPTEAEWERVARGKGGAQFPWGNEWNNEKCNSRERAKFRATKVSYYEEGQTSDGVFNMCGNVWEWCSDWYDKDYYENSAKENPKGPQRGATKVIRGGSWDTYGSDRMTTFSRESQFPSTKSYDIGFRCVKDLE